MKIIIFVFFVQYIAFSASQGQTVGPSPFDDGNVKVPSKCFISQSGSTNASGTECALPFTFQKEENGEVIEFNECPTFDTAMPHGWVGGNRDSLWCPPPGLNNYQAFNEATQTEWYPCTCINDQPTQEPTFAPTSSLSCRLRKAQPTVKLLAKGFEDVGDPLELCKFPFIYNDKRQFECVVDPEDKDDPDLKWGWCETEAGNYGTCLCTETSDETSTVPTQMPTTGNPTVSPTTSEPTSAPTLTPTGSPTPEPSAAPTSAPTQKIYETATFRTHLQVNENSFASELTSDHASDLARTIKCYFNFLFVQSSGITWAVDLPIDDEYPDLLVQSVQVIDLEEDLKQGEGKTFRIDFNLHVDRLSLNEKETRKAVDTATPVSESTVAPSVEVAATINGSNSTGTLAPTSAPVTLVTVPDYMHQLINKDVPGLYQFKLTRWGEFVWRVGDGLISDVDETEPSTVEFEPNTRFCWSYRDSWEENTITSENTTTSAPTISPVPRVPDPPSVLDQESIIALCVGIPLLLIAIIVVIFRTKRKSHWFRKLVGIEASEKHDDVYPELGKRVDSSNPNFAQFKDLHIELSKLTLGRLIGHGANGRIFRATYCGSDVAVKELFPEILKNRSDSDANNDWESIWREVKHLRLLRHPHIIQLYGCTKVTGSNTNRCLLVMELARCSLLELLNGSPKAEPLSIINDDWHRKILLTRQVCAGCAYIHDNNMIHFDIKPANILLDMSGNAKICDLGIAKITKGPNSRIDMTASAMGGTPPYMAPELLRGDTELIGTPVDVYGFGIVLWQIFHRKSPHPSDWTIAKLFHEVMINNYRPEIDMSKLEVPEIVTIMKNCWHASCHERPTFHTLIKAFDKFLATESEREPSQVEKQYEEDEIVGVWTPFQRKYVPGRVVGVHQMEKTGDFEYDIEFIHEGEKKSGVSANDLIQYNPDFTLNTMSPFKSIVGLALEHAEGLEDMKQERNSIPQGMSLKFVRQQEEPQHEQPTISTTAASKGDSAVAGKTFLLREGQLELQGLRFTKEGFDMNLDRPRVNKSVLMKYAMLGQGASGKVHAALHIPTFTLVAVKEIRFVEKQARHQAVREIKVLWRNLINIPTTSPREGLHDDGPDGAGNDQGTPKQQQVETPQEERDLSRRPMQLKQCPQIVALYDAYLDEEEECVSLVMEHMDGGSLQDIIVKHCKPLSEGVDELPTATGICDEDVLADIARDVLKALCYLHSHELIHLDIKPANVLLNINGHAKLADFGLAKQLEAVRQYEANTFVGTMKYMSPERLRGESYSFPSDIWSFALTLMTVVLGRFPVDFANADETMDESTPRAEPTDTKGSSVYWSLLELFRKKSFPKLPEEVKLSGSLHEKSPRERHRFSELFVDFLNLGLNIDASSRPTAESLLNHPWLQEHQMQTPRLNKFEQLQANRSRLSRILTTAINMPGLLCTQLGEKEISVNEEKLARLAEQLELPVEVVKSELSLILEAHAVSP